MGGGRKTKNFTEKEKPPPSRTVNSRVTSRNLVKKKLAGVIFGCKHETMHECLSEQLFGLPACHYSYIRNIEPGLPLFLFNYSDRKLHGIFEATSQGSLNIKPYAWTFDGDDFTPYPAQVKIKNQTQCHPLSEDQFRPVIAANYYASKLFWFELDQSQTKKLIALFASSPILETFSLPRRTSNLSKALPPINAIASTSEAKSHFEGSDSNINVAPSGLKTWSSLFKVSTTDAKKDGVGFKKPSPESNLLYSNHPKKEKNQSCEAPMGACGIHNEELDEIYSFSYHSDVNLEGEYHKSTALEVNLPYSSQSDWNWDSSFDAHQSREIGRVMDNLDLKDAKEKMEDVYCKTDGENLLKVNHGEDTF